MLNRQAVVAQRSRCCRLRMKTLVCKTVSRVQSGSRAATSQMSSQELQCKRAHRRTPGFVCNHKEVAAYAEATASLGDARLHISATVMSSA